MFPIPWTSDVCGISTGFSQHALSLEIQVRSAWVPAACCRPTVSLVPGLGSGEAAVVADAFLVTCAHSVTLQMAPLPSPRSVPLQVPHPALLTVPPHPRLSSHPASSPLSLEFTKPMAPPPHVALWCLRPNSLTHFAGQSLSPSGLASKTTLCQGTLMVSAK